MATEGANSIFEIATDDVWPSSRDDTMGAALRLLDFLHNGAPILATPDEVPPDVLGTKADTTFGQWTSCNVFYSVNVSVKCFPRVHYI